MDRREKFTKAFTLYQPWAELIIQGRKKIELRDRKTKIKGLIAVRSAKDVLRRECDRHNIDCDKIPKGMIEGTVEITEIIEFAQELWEALRNELLSPMPNPRNKKGWRLSNP